MSLKFKCKSCNADIIVKYLKVGEEAQCKNCGAVIRVPKDAVETDEQPPKPPQIALKQIVRQVSPETSKAVTFVKFLVDAFYYVVIILGVLIILFYPMHWFKMGNSNDTLLVQLPLEIDVTYDSEGPFSEVEKISTYETFLITGHNDIEVRIGGTRWTLFFFVTSVISIAGLVWIVQQIRRLFKDVKAGRPFTVENVRRVRWVGYVILAYGPIDGLLSFIFGAVYFDDLAEFVKEHFSGTALGISFNPHLDIIFVGLVIIVLAHIFELGARLQKEQDLTV